MKWRTAIDWFWKVLRAPVGEWVLRIGLCVFFFWSGWVKLADLGAFTESVGNYQFPFLAAPVDAVIAYSLPWVEIFAAVALLTPWGKLGGLLSISAMLVVFSVAIAVVWSQGLNINCGCFGKDGEPTNYPLKIASNVILFGISVFLMFWPREKVTGVDERLASS